MAVRFVLALVKMHSRRPETGATHGERSIRNTRTRGRIDHIGPRRQRTLPRGVEITYLRGVLVVQRTCQVEGCDRRNSAKGYCSAHYARWRATGSPGSVEIPSPVRNGERCRVEGCDRLPISRNLCHPHYARWRANGDPGEATIRKRMATDGKCTFPGCGERHEAFGLCPGHYAQRKSGRQLVSLEPRHNVSIRDELGRKRCNVCTEWFPLADFSRNKTATDGFSTCCRACQRQRSLLKRFGLSLAQYDDLLRAHDGACAICRRSNPTGRRLSVDHDHACCSERDRGCGKCVRGLLCNNCNAGIGYFADNPRMLRRAAEYLLGGWSATVDA